ncbi:MAG: dTMP kinase [Acidobacteria bacterium]|nr:dTMP kinase [Acidobacteriota bacterium]
MTDTPARGLFITLEGTDGSGKTTQLSRLIARLREAGHTVTETAEPGGTAIGKKIRAILLDPAHQELHRTTELLLYFAARAQNVHELILPALARGEIVVCDRFTDSTLVYQGAGRKFGADLVLALHEIACGTLFPDLTVYLDVDLEAGLERVRTSRGHIDRMDGQSIEFHHRVRAAYLDLAAAHPQRFRVIDASPAADDVEQAVWMAVKAELEQRHVR